MSATYVVKDSDGDYFVALGDRVGWVKRQRDADKLTSRGARLVEKRIGRFVRIVRLIPKKPAPSHGAVIFETLRKAVGAPPLKHVATIAADVRAIEDAALMQAGRDEERDAIATWLEETMAAPYEAERVREGAHRRHS